MIIPIADTLSLLLISAVFAMAPVGVLTAIVGAIRVGGASWLKRLSGRARETNATVEVELRSSVSQEVCELWNGKSIVRSTGQPEVKQIIHLPAEKGDISPESFITMEPWTQTGCYKLRAQDSSADVDFESQAPKDTVDVKEYKEYKDMPPNISLNVHGGSNPIEVIWCAIFATTLQVGVLLWSGILAYYSSFVHKHKLSGGLKPRVGFQLQAFGTVLLTLSLVLCAGIIDNGSCERQWSRERDSQMGSQAKDQFSEKKAFDRRKIKLYWVQKRHTVGDNNLNSYILCAEEPHGEIYESHKAEENSLNDRKDKSFKSKLRLPFKFQRFLGPSQKKKKNRSSYTLPAVALGILGFVSQFQGLRLSHWSCSIAQLLALVAATILRAWVRRGMTKTPMAVQVDDDHLLDNLALAIVGANSSDSKFPDTEALRSPGLSLAFGAASAPVCRLIAVRHWSASEHLNRTSSEPNLAQQALDLRARLGRITQWTGPKSQEAIILSHSVETALNWLGSRLELVRWDKKFAVVLQVNTCRLTPSAAPTSMPGSSLEMEPKIIEEEVELCMIRDDGGFKVDDAQLEALLSLVSCSARAAEPVAKAHSVENSRSIGWLRGKAPTQDKIYHFVVGKSSPELLCDLLWWTPYFAEDGFEKVKLSDPGMKVAVSRGGLFTTSKRNRFDPFSVEVVERPTLGFYKNQETSGENGIVIFQLHMWIALICLDTFWSFECGEREAFVLHLFSMFIWAWVDCNSCLPMESNTVTVAKRLPDSESSKTRGASFTMEHDWKGVPHLDPQHNRLERLVQRLESMELNVSEEIKLECWKRVPQLKDDRLERLVQKLESMGLGTSEEIYRIFIPPLSQSNKLPSHSLIGWCNKTLLKPVESGKWHYSLVLCHDLLKVVQFREVYDEFADKAAEAVIEFLLRVHEDTIILMDLENLKKCILDQVPLKLVADDSKLYFFKNRVGSQPTGSIITLKEVFTKALTRDNRPDLLSILGVQNEDYEDLPLITRWMRDYNLRKKENVRATARQ